MPARPHPHATTGLPEADPLGPGAFWGTAGSGSSTGLCRLPPLYQLRAPPLSSNRCQKQHLPTVEPELPKGLALLGICPSPSGKSVTETGTEALRCVHAFNPQITLAAQTRLVHSCFPSGEPEARARTASCHQHTASMPRATCHLPRLSHRSPGPVCLPSLTLQASLPGGWVYVHIVQIRKMMPRKQVIMTPKLSKLPVTAQTLGGRGTQEVPSLPRVPWLDNLCGGRFIHEET